VLAHAGRFITPATTAEALGIDADEAVKKLARWAEQGWVRRVRRGLYIGVPVDAASPRAWSEDALVVATQVWSPCYFTGWTAAHHWGLTEQVFNTTVLKTAGRVRSTSVRLLDHDYEVRHVDAGTLGWGLRTEWRAEVRLRFADPARTLVEILDSPKLGGGIRHASEVLTTYLNDYNPMDLVDSAERLGNRAVFKRLGYLLEVLELDHPELAAACERNVSAGIALLDPDSPVSGRRVMRWRLRVNVTVVPEGAS
jgi:predicted transcriptional regulator of viral defense system